MNFYRFSEGLRLGMSPQVADQMTKVYMGGDDEEPQETTSTPYQSANYDKLLEKSDSWLANGGLDKNYGGSADFDPVANLNQSQKDAIDGMGSQSSNLQSMYNTQGNASLSDYLGAYDPNKTGLNSAINAANSNLDWNYSTQVAPQIRQGAVQTGQYGSSRNGVAEGIAQSQLSQQKMNSASQLAYQDQQQYNTNRLNVLNNLSNITSGLNSGYTSQYNSGALQQKQDQSEIDGGLNKWAYENNANMNDLLAYRQLIGGDMGGTGTQPKAGGGGPSTLGTIGTVAGGVIGGIYGGPMGAAAGASAGGAIGGAVG